MRTGEINCLKDVTRALLLNTQLPEPLRVWWTEAGVETRLLRVASAAHELGCFARCPTTTRYIFDTRLVYKLKHRWNTLHPPVLCKLASESACPVA
jgi:hypothetical protein